MAARTVEWALVPVAVGAAILAGACRAPFEYAEWLLPVPPDTRLVGYVDVPPAERVENRIELVEDLTLGGPGSLLGRQPARVAVFPDGGIAVLDPGNFRVLLYAPDGGFLTSFGRRGQGPEEFGQPGELFVGDDGLLRVWDIPGRRLSRWTAAGVLVDAVTLPRWGSQIVPLSGGDLAWREGRRTPEGSESHFLRVDGRGEPVHQFAQLPWPERTIDPPIGMISGTESNAWWVGKVPPSFTASADGAVYISPFAEYQVFAYAPEGTLRWALQVAHERPPVARIEIDHHMEIHARRFPQRSESQIEWPDRQYALADIRVDGHGHLYVFPYVPKGTPLEEPRPVDVYDADGNRLFSGTIAGRNFSTSSATYNGPMYEVAWQASVGDFVFGLADNAAGDREVVRFRLQEPF